MFFRRNCISETKKIANKISYFLSGDNVCSEIILRTQWAFLRAQYKALNRDVCIQNNSFYTWHNTTYDNKYHNAQ